MALITLPQSETRERPAPTPVDERHPNAGAGRHLLFLDHLRGAAILMVFLYHSFQTLGLKPNEAGIPDLSSWLHAPRWTWIFFPLSLGWAGVALFFVISGFCIHLSHGRSGDKSFKTFFLRRFFRIYPPYFIALLLFALVFPVTRLAFAAPHDFTNLIVHLFLLHNLDSSSMLTVNPAFWSLGVEAQLYLIYPLLLVLVRRIGWNGTLVFLLGMGLVLVNFPSLRFAFAHWIPEQFNSLTRSPFAYWFCWALGARMADDWLEHRPIFLSTWPVIPFLLVFVLCSLVDPLVRFSFICGSLAFAVFMARLMVNPRMQEHLRRLPFGEHLRRVGLISYSLYLLHFPFIRMLPGLLPSPNLDFGLSLLEWPFICLLAWAFYHTVEMPSISFGKKILHPVH